MFLLRISYLRLVFGGALLIASGCGEKSADDSGIAVIRAAAVSTVTAPAPPSTSIPAPSPTPSRRVPGLQGRLPSDIRIANPAPLRVDKDVPSFHFPDTPADHFYDPANFEANFPRLTTWGECITQRRDHPARQPARCVFRRFALIETDPSGNEQQIATFDFGRSGAIECGFKGGDRDEGTFCAGANYRRERNGTLCWYSWCLIGPQPTDEGMAPMGNRGKIIEGRFVIDAARQPTVVAHWWTQIPGGGPHPVTRASQGYRYSLVVEVYAEGKAAFRVGADRWILDEGGEERACDRYPGAPPRRNCELFFSNWFVDNSGTSMFKTFRFKLAG